MGKDDPEPGYPTGDLKMLKTRYTFIFLGMLLYPLASPAEVSVSIGINLPIYPNLVAVPGYPVYYAPQLQANFFFYDGMYWVYQNDNWYTSSWYNGPWWLVNPDQVPVFILRVPVQYYRQPPPYFKGWRSDAPPRWGDHWGHDWEQRRSGWDRWNHSAVPAPAPLPTYQRRYSREHYPQQVQQQQKLQQQQYRYKPRDPVARLHYQAVQPAHPQQRRAPEERSVKQQNIQNPTPHQQAAPRPRQEVRKPDIPGQEQNPAQPAKPIQHGQQKSQAHGQEERQQGQNAQREKKQEWGRDRND
jgi:hypothetical protein